MIASSDANGSSIKSNRGPGAITCAIATRFSCRPRVRAGNGLRRQATPTHERARFCVGCWYDPQLSVAKGTKEMVKVMRRHGFTPAPPPAP